MDAQGPSRASASVAATGCHLPDGAGNQTHEGAQDQYYFRPGPHGAVAQSCAAARASTFRCTPSRQARSSAYSGGSGPAGHAAQPVAKQCTAAGGESSSFTDFADNRTDAAFRAEPAQGQL